MQNSTRISGGKQKKIDQVKALEDKLSRAKAFFLADYRGLKHKQLESLKKSLKKADGEIVVAKNTLLKIALKQNVTIENATMQQFETELREPTATLFAYGDEMAPVKALADFIKANQLPRVKIGFFEGKLATEADFKNLASLPTRDILLATLAMRMKGPIYGLHYACRWNLQRVVIALDQVAKKKPAN